MAESNELLASESSEVNLQAINYEQLLAFAKSTFNQNKALSAKNLKLQGKYIEAFKELKALRGESSTFGAFLKLVFKEQLDKSTGPWQIEELSSKWEKLEHGLAQKASTQATEAVRDKQQQQQKQLLVLEERRVQVQRELSDQVEKLKTQIDLLESRNQELAAELKIVQGKLISKEAQLKQTRAQRLHFQAEVQRIKVNEVKSQLQQTLKAFQHKPEDNQARVQILLIKQELDRVHQKNQQLAQMVSKLQTKIRAKNKEIQIMKEKQDFNPPKPSQSPLPPTVQIQLEPNPEPKQKQRQKQKQREVDVLQKQYLKNVFMRFMKCLNDGNYVQAQILENVLMTLLQFNSREKELAVIRQKQWWNIF